jgi:single-stranded-DNA-specific exonuclease
MREFARAENCGLRELLRVSCADPASPDSNDLAFGVAPRINAAGRIDHPARALSVFEAGEDEDAARRCVERLDQFNQQRRQLVAAHFGGLCAEIPEPAPPALVLYRESCPKGIAGLLAAKCVERFRVPGIVLAPAPEPGLVVGSGRSVAGFDLAEALEQFRVVVQFEKRGPLLQAASGPRFFQCSSRMPHNVWQREITAVTLRACMLTVSRRTDLVIHVE